MTDKPPVRMEPLDANADGRRYSPSASRNRSDIVDALVEELPQRGVCLEVAAGTGEHAVLAASKLPEWTWLPTDRDAEALVSIQAWVAHAALPNLLDPVLLKLGEAWPCAPESQDAIFASNVVHIAPIATTEALLAGAAKHLKRTGVLLVYGAVFLPDESRPSGNVEFDRELREKDPAYGIRTLQQLQQLAARSGLAEPTVRRMPTNNVLLRFERA